MGRRRGKGKRLLWRAGLVLAWLLGAGHMDSTVRAQEEDCLRCHDETKPWFKKKVKHKPFNDKKCDACHDFHEFERKLVLKREGKDLCIECHRDFEYQLKGTIHSPVAEGQCWTCHDPHSSNQKKLLRDAEGGSPCFTCHPTIQFDLHTNHPHAPFYDKECVSCHSPHASENAYFLKQRPDLLCSSCHSWGKVREKHTDYFDVLTDCTVCHRAHGSSRKSLLDPDIHPPVLDACDNCHEPVKAGVEPVLEAPEEELCLMCHDDVGSDVQFAHPPVESGECLSCHRPHRSLQTSLLRGRGAEVCAECHDLEPDGEPESVHRPFVDAECARCHDAHGAEHGGLQKAGTPENCYQCHRHMNAQVSTAEVVHPPVEDGDCALCHAPHSSEFKHLQTAETKELCGECHDLEPVGPSVHSPFAGGVCVACHTIHSGAEGLQRWTDENWCVRCHEDLIEVVNSETVHPPVADDCQICHVGHSSEHGPLLRAAQGELCADCHGDVETEVADHPEVAGEKCSECHDPHEL